jgi:hypothetical protein
VKLTTHVKSSAEVRMAWYIVKHRDNFDLWWGMLIRSFYRSCFILIRLCLRSFDGRSG